MVQFVCLLHPSCHVFVGSAVLIAGHVTKSGEVAGPRILEHMVDTGMFAFIQTELFVRVNNQFFVRHHQCYTWKATNNQSTASCAA